MTMRIKGRLGRRSIKSSLPRRQRLNRYNSPLHRKRKLISSHLDEPLLMKYNKRSLPVIKGDTVRIMRGKYKGHEGKIVRIDSKKMKVGVDGVVITKADGKQVPMLVDPSNLLIIKLDLSDKRRKSRLESFSKGMQEEEE